MLKIFQNHDEEIPTREISEPPAYNEIFFTRESNSGFSSSSNQILNPAEIYLIANQNFSELEKTESKSETPNPNEGSNPKIQNFNEN